jgi:hypothetical protein
MSEAAPSAPQRRRIDRVTEPDLLEDIGQRSVSEVRELRDACRQEEAHLSFARRILQARLDIVRSLVARRGGEGWDAEDLIAWLPEVLADVRREPDEGGPRATPVVEPPGESQGRRSSDWLIFDASLGRVPDLSDEELFGLVDRLSDEERRVSDVRRLVLDRLDALQAELVRRYSADASIVSEVVSSAAADPRRP